jgi:hypothetical protein
MAYTNFETNEEGSVTQVNRPSCWMSMIPAGGALLMPEGSVGCTCTYPYQGSIVLMPTENDDPDSDSDGLPDDWERTHYGTTSVTPTNRVSNGINTVRQAYIAGLNPTNAQSRFQLDDLQTLTDDNILTWEGVSGRRYTVYWASNLLDGFQLLQTNISATGTIFTDSLHRAHQKGFYKIEVEKKTD